MNLEKLLIRSSRVSLALGAIFFIVGMSTYIWTPVKGQYQTSHFVAAGGHGYNSVHTRVARANVGGGYSLQAVDYVYWVESKGFESSLICICVPIAVLDRVPVKGADVTVYVAPGASGLSVLVRGPDLGVLMFFVFFGFAFGYLARILRNWSHNNSLQARRP